MRPALCRSLCVGLNVCVCVCVCVEGLLYWGAGGFGERLVM